jgi:hypothetical protein
MSGQQHMRQRGDAKVSMVLRHLDPASPSTGVHIIRRLGENVIRY